MNIVLETERLILRNPTVDDYQAMFKWCGDPEVNEFMFYTLYKNAEECIDYIKSLNPNNPDNCELLFTLKETGDVIGMGGINYHPEKNSWEIGYNLRRDMWGNGYTTEALNAIIAHVKATGRLHSMYGTFAKANSKSCRVMEKLGMTYSEDTTYTKMDGSRTFDAKTYMKLFD